MFVFLAKIVFLLCLGRDLFVVCLDLVVFWFVLLFLVLVFLPTYTLSLDLNLSLNLLKVVVVNISVAHCCWPLLWWTFLAVWFLLDVLNLTTWYCCYLVAWELFCWSCSCLGQVLEILLLWIGVGRWIVVVLEDCCYCSWCGCCCSWSSSPSFIYC